MHLTFDIVAKSCQLPASATMLWNYLSVNPDRPKRERERERSQEEERYQEASRLAEKAENVSPG